MNCNKCMRVYVPFIEVRCLLNVRALVVGMCAVVILHIILLTVHVSYLDTLTFLVYPFIWKTPTIFCLTRSIASYMRKNSCYHAYHSKMSVFLIVHVLFCTRKF